MLCPKCGAENPLDATRCSECADSLAIAVLEVVRGDVAEKIRFLKPRPYQVGRARHSDIAINEPSISKLHARLDFQDGRFFIEDAGSLHGIYVNAAKVRRAELTAGAQVQLGNDTLKIPPLGMEAATGAVGKLSWLEQQQLLLFLVETLNSTLLLSQILGQVVKALALPRIPDHTTLQRTYKKLRKLDFEKMKNQLLEAENIQEDVIASDSTGFSPGQASLYYQTRTGRTYQHWFKGAYAIGTTSQYILAWQSGIGPSGDMAHLQALKKGSARYGTHDNNKRSWLMLADSGFDGQQVNDLDIIPPIRKHGKLVDPTRKARADLVSQARLDGLYGQRWKTETVISVIKRKFGDTIRSRRKQLQSREPIIKGLVYNIHL